MLMFYEDFDLVDHLYIWYKDTWFITAEKNVYLKKINKYKNGLKYDQNNHLY